MKDDKATEYEYDDTKRNVKRIKDFSPARLEEIEEKVVDWLDRHKVECADLTHIVGIMKTLEGVEGDHVLEAINDSTELHIIKGNINGKGADILLYAPGFPDPVRIASARKERLKLALEVVAEETKGRLLSAWEVKPPGGRDYFVTVEEITSGKMMFDCPNCRKPLTKKIADEFGFCPGCNSRFPKNMPWRLTSVQMKE